MMNLKLALRTPLQDARSSPSSRSCRWRSASAPTRRSSRCSTRCCCGRCRCSEPARLVNLVGAGPEARARTRATRPATATRCSATRCSAISSARRRSFTGIAAHRLFGANLAYRGQTLSGEGMLVSGSYFPVLGVQPALGRLLGPDDDATIGESPVVVLSYALLEDALRRRPERLERDDHRQRPVADDRRRGAARVQRHHARRDAAGLRADHDARAHAAGLQGRSRTAAATGSTSSRG